MTQIEHDPEEQKIDRTPFHWWIGWVLVAFVWAVSLYHNLIDWHSLALGGFTFGYLATWAIEKTGNKAPNSWRKKR